MATPNEIVVLARWQVADGAVEQVLALATELRTLSLTEPGCLGYEIFQSPAEPATLLLVERYRDSAAIQAHRQSAHYQSLAAGRILPQLVRRQVELLQARDPV